MSCEMLYCWCLPISRYVIDPYVSPTVISIIKIYLHFLIPLYHLKSQNAGKSSYWCHWLCQKGHLTKISPLGSSRSPTLFIGRNVHCYTSCDSIINSSHTHYCTFSPNVNDILQWFARSCGSVTWRPSGL